AEHQGYRQSRASTVRQSLGIICSIASATFSNMPDSLSTPRNTAAAIMTEAIINALGACSLIRSICNLAELKFSGSSTATPSTKLKAGSNQPASMVVITAITTTILSQ